MTWLEVARAITAEKSAQLVRPRKDAPGQYDAKRYEGSKRGWIWLDLVTASMLVQIYDALNEVNRAKFAGLPLLKAVNVGWKLVR
jgi:hypothetical protein